MRGHGFPLRVLVGNISSVRGGTFVILRGTFFRLFSRTPHPVVTGSFGENWYKYDQTENGRFAMVTGPATERKYRLIIHA